MILKVNFSTKWKLFKTCYLRDSLSFLFYRKVMLRFSDNPLPNEICNLWRHDEHYVWWRVIFLDIFWLVNHKTTKRRQLKGIIKGNIFWEKFWITWRTSTWFQDLFNLPTYCSNYYAPIVRFFTCLRGRSSHRRCSVRKIHRKTPVPESLF